MTNDFHEPAPRGAAYVRMSKKHQGLSMGKQMDTIRRFAKQHGLKITKVLFDRSAKLEAGKCPNRH
jgi:DNA invertase Pin-like site-specific DNA recombinase